MNEWSRLNSHHTRLIFIGCLVALGVSLGVAGTVILMRWQAERTMQGNAPAMLAQAESQLVQALDSRRQTFRVFREAVDKAPELGEAGRSALAVSTVGHIPHLIGSGWVDRRGVVSWWVAPTSLDPDALVRETLKRAWARTLFRMPSTMTGALATDRPVIVMIEPLRAPANRSHALVAVFDGKVFLADFFQRAVPPSASVQVVESGRLLYRSGRWPPADSIQQVPMVEHPVTFEGIRWLFQMPPETAPLLPLLWFRVLVVLSAVLIGLATVGMVWTAERLRQLATTDELTGLYNRRFFLERWEEESGRAARYQRELSCLMMDINGFKRVNDLLGHQMGDRVLQQVAQAVRTHVRQSDVVARFGGDEFIVALPEASLQAARVVSQKLRALSIEGPWVSQVGPISLSVGVSRLEVGEPPKRAIERADADLYASRGVQPLEGRSPGDITRHPVARPLS